ncbi:MAG TPA: glycoside hydrolase family 3 N-terminal domain-containing protein [Terracidiphilus sp.]
MTSRMCVIALYLLPSAGLSAQAARQRGNLHQRQDTRPESRVENLLRQMTAQEKVRQLDFYAGATDLMSSYSDKTHAGPDASFVSAKAQALFGTEGVGAIHDLNPTPEQANTIQRWVITHTRLGIPVLFIEEGLHGYDTGTVFPAPIGLAATWDTELAERTGADIASEARAHGVGMVLAPVLDLARDPRWGRVEEDFGEDPYLTGQMGLAFVRGAQGSSLRSEGSVVAEPKHFVGHGSPEGGTNTSPVHIGERELRTVMLKSFEPAIREGHAMGVMAAYHEIDGVPMTADPQLFKQILRTEWGFRGFVLSDLGAIQRLYTAHHVAATPADAACMATRSGVDMQFYDFPHDVFEGALLECLRDGRLSTEDLDRAVRGVLRVKFELGLFDHPFVDQALVAQRYRAAPHLADSLRSARESMTLLKNDGVLPLSKSLHSLAIIGPNAAVARYGDYEGESNGLHISLVDGLRRELPGTTILFNEGNDIAEAVATARQADAVVLALGERPGISGEGHDRSTLDLPGDQESLLEAVYAANPRVVLVLENGRPLTVTWAAEHVPAILEAWYPGEYGGQAIAETLFGDNNPSGHLTITFPHSVGELPDFYNSDPSRRYAYIDDKGEPLFRFGFGLSYTTFSYQHLSVTLTHPAQGLHAASLDASVDVTNTGQREGVAVPQLYLREDTTSVETPERSLKGFARVDLKPGEEKTVHFTVPVSELAVWSTAGKWEIEPGSFTAWVGGSSDAGLKGTFRLPTEKKGE